VTTPWFDLVDGEHDGYKRFSDPVRHRRAIVFLKPGIWLIWDDLVAAQRHRIEALLHVRPDCVISEVLGDAGLILAAPGGNRLHVRFVDEGRTAGSFAVIAGDERERGAWYSSHYGERSPSRAISVTRDLLGRSSLVTCLSTSALVRPVVSEGPGALGIRIEHADGTEERLGYVTDGTGIPPMEGIRFDGGLLFERRGPGSHAVVHATRFRELSIDGVLDLRSPALVERLTLEGNRCEVVLEGNETSRLQFHARQGIELQRVAGEVDGQAAQDLERPDVVGRPLGP
jgi:hypothetical protein